MPAMTSTKKLKLGLIIYAVVMLATALLPLATGNLLIGVRNELSETKGRVEALNALMSSIKDAETGQRGFIITGDEEYLTPFYTASVEGPKTLDKLQQETASLPAYAKQLPSIHALVDLKMAELRETIQIRRSMGFEKVLPIVQSARGKKYMDDLRDSVSRLEKSDLTRAAYLATRVQYFSEISRNVVVSVTLIDLLFLMMVLKFLFGVLQAQAAATNQISLSAIAVKEALDLAEEKNDEISAFAAMNTAFDCAASVDDTFKIIGHFGSKFLPATSGTIRLFRNSRDLIEVKAHWGDLPNETELLTVDECLALRTGRPHLYFGKDEMPCSHYGDKVNRTHAHCCIPLTAQGEILGLVCIDHNDETCKEQLHKEMALATRLSEHISLGLANAIVREKLRLQSIIDPLTGLYNRRYFDESIRRDFARAERQKESLSIIMLDIDHFKNVNDTYGHETGDHVLEKISAIFQVSTRGADFVCRFGGEEMIVVLPGCKKTDALMRAEILRSSINQLQIEFHGRRIINLSASFGVAAFSQDGPTIDKIIAAADGALYKAKNSGRNKVVGA